MCQETCSNDSCRCTPLVKFNNMKLMECVSCESKYEWSDSKLIEVQINSDSTGDDTSANSNNSVQLANSQLLNDASREISKKLLLGWSLLNQVCTKSCDGDVPLMKDLNGHVRL